MAIRSFTLENDNEIFESRIMTVRSLNLEIGQSNL